MNRIQEAKSKFPSEFSEHAKCLDKNDYRFNDCRASESAFLGAWNSYRGYTNEEKK